MVPPKDFQRVFMAALKKGEEAMSELIELYEWARVHIREVHAVWPDFTMEWASDMIEALFGIDPPTYLRMISRLGDGDSKKGKTLMKKYGISHVFRADRLLGPDQIKMVVQRKPKDGDEFKKLVDTTYQKELASLRLEKNKNRKGKKRFIRIEKAEYEKLINRCTELAEKCKALQAELNWFRKNVKISAA